MKTGFTLIELLVVVLIIGILAAVALPQYEKAVWKSRNTQLKTAVRSIAQAQDAFLLATGQTAGDFNQLDIDLPLTAVPSSVGGVSGPCDNVTQGADAIRQGKNFQIILNNASNTTGSVTGVWIDGPYKCNGFSRTVGPNGEFFCTESRNGRATSAPDAFCRGIEQGVKGALMASWQRYTLP